MFVSHNLGAVMTLCSRAIVLDEGRILFDGDVSTAVSHYRQRTSLAATGTLETPGKHRNRRGSLRLIEAKITSKGIFNPNGYFTGDPLEFAVGLSANTLMDRLAVGIEISSIFGERIATVHSTNNSGDDPYATGGPGRLDFKCVLEKSYLAPGIYTAKMQIECDQGGFTADPAFSFEILQRDQGRKARGGLKEGLLLLPSEWSLPDPLDRT